MSYFVKRDSKLAKPRISLVHLLKKGRNKKQREQTQRSSVKQTKPQKKQKQSNNTMLRRYLVFTAQHRPLKSSPAAGFCPPPSLNFNWQPN